VNPHTIIKKFNPWDLKPNMEMKKLEKIQHPQFLQFWKDAYYFQIRQPKFTVLPKFGAKMTTMFGPIFLE